MPRIGTLLAVAVVAMVSGCVQQEDATPSVARTETVVTRAVIDDIDRANRTLTLRTDDGRTFVMPASEQVRNFDQVETGDVMELTYRKEVAVNLAEPGVQGSDSGDWVVAMAPEGAKPGIVAGTASVTIVEFVAFDPRTGIATFIRPDGVTATATVANEIRQFAATLRSGDRVRVAVDRAVALGVRSIAD